MKLSTNELLPSFQHVHWRVLSGLCCVFPLLSLVLMFFIPESPAWLVTQGRLSEARRALRQLRGADYDIEQEFSRLTRQVQITTRKVRNIKPVHLIRSYELTKTARSKPEIGNWREKAKSVLVKCQRPDVLKPLILMTILMFCQQFSGTATISYYAYEVMASTGSNIDKSDATIIYGVTRLAATFIGALLLRRRLVHSGCGVHNISPY